jgi:hypothetical protein
MALAGQSLRDRPSGVLFASLTERSNPSTFGERQGGSRLGGGGGEGGIRTPGTFRHT